MKARWYWSATLVVLGLGALASANLVEDFESYDVGAFVAQTGGAWSGSADWQITDDGSGSNKALILNYPVADIALMYAAETFSSAGEGYAILARMKPLSGGYWCSHYSGWLCDADAANPTSNDHAHRFYVADGAQFFTIGGGVLTDSWSNTWNAWVYMMQTRVGDNVKIWLSASPIDPYNPGTPIIDGTVPALGNGGNSIGLYGIGPVYYDDLAFVQIPEPGTLILLAGVGSILAARRKRRV